MNKEREIIKCLTIHRATITLYIEFYNDKKHKNSGESIRNTAKL